jgi:hypothetical protein
MQIEHSRQAFFASLSLSFKVWQIEPISYATAMSFCLWKIGLMGG